MVLLALDQKFEISIRQLDTMVSLMANHMERIKNFSNENKSLDQGQETTYFIELKIKIRRKLK